MKIKYGLKEDRTFLCDTVITEDNRPLDPDAVYWTADDVPPLMYTPMYVGGDVSDTGEISGGEWVDLGRTVVDSPEVEILWRNQELFRADIELNKVQDGMGVGTVSAWRTYRCQLRNWPEHPDFPCKDKRPVAPM